MTEEVEGLALRLEANIRRFDEQLKKAVRLTKSTEDKLNKSAEKVDVAWSKVGASLAKRLAPVVVVESLRRVARQSIDTADALDKLAISADLPVERLQTLRFAAQQTGAGADFVTAGFERFGRRLGEFVSTGGGPAAAALKDLGLASKVVAGEFPTTEAALDAVLGKLAALPTANARAAQAAKLFGDDAGPRLSRLLAVGSDGIKELEDRARVLNLVLSEESIKSAVALGDKWAEIVGKMEMTFTSFALKVVNSLDAIFSITDTEQLKDAVSDLRDVQNAIAEIHMRPGPPTKAEQDILDRLAVKEAELSGDVSRLGNAHVSRLAAVAKIATPSTTGSSGGAKSTKERRTFADILDSSLGVQTDLLNDADLLGATPERIAERREELRLLAEVYDEFGGTAAEINRAMKAGLLPEDYVAQIRAEAAAVGEAAGAYEEKRKAMEAASEATQRQTEAVRDLVNGLGGLLQNASSTTDFLQGLVKLFATQAIQGLATGGGVFGGIANSLLGVSSGGLFGSGGVFAPKARGGPISSGRGYLVGEEGPELIVPRAAGRVLNAVDTARTLSGGGPAPAAAPINVHISTPDVEGFRRSRAQVAREIAGAVGRARQFS